MQVFKSPTHHGRPTTRAHLASTLLPLALLALAGCQNDPDEKAPACPIARTEPDAATLSRYDGRGTDLTNLVLHAQLVDVKGACKGLLGHTKLSAHAHAELVVTRGPAATSRNADLQYNVAVVKQGVVLEKKAYTQHVTFPANVDTVQVTGEEVSFEFPTQRGLTGPSYDIFFVLELTPQELAANQRALQAK